MRLLTWNEYGDLDMVEFIGDDIVPPYAILSHTWGANETEVSYQDILNSTAKTKIGYRKIKRCGLQAKMNDLKYFWVDTCSIDKSSSAELTESINSMFSWYQKASVCYVFLEDMYPGTPKDALVECRWFTRGWTLQEMLAPRDLRFYDAGWNCLGSLEDFKRPIQKVTGIPLRVLTGAWKLSDISIAQRMSWAAKRKTTRIEDVAYCLLGIFGINMPLIYGEGTQAFRRLQEEIVKSTTDLTIFAWDLPHVERHKQQVISFFAPSPAAFKDSQCTSTIPYGFDGSSITNKGLLISGELPLVAPANDCHCGTSRYIFLLAESSASSSSVGIYLRKIAPRFFYRDGTLPLASFTPEYSPSDAGFVSTSNFLIASDLKALGLAWPFRNLTVHVPRGDVFKLYDTAPSSLWDATDNVFLRPRADHASIGSKEVLALHFEVILNNQPARFIVLCHHPSEVPTCKIYLRDQFRFETEFIFGAHNKDPLPWASLQFQMPQLSNLDSFIQVEQGSRVFEVSATFEETVVQTLAGETNVWSLQLNAAQIGSK